MDKTIESVAVEVDEVGLAALGWTAEDVRARLVTEALPDGSVMQRLTVAGTAVFRPADWAPRFGPEVDAPHLLVALRRRDRAGAPGYGELVAETAALAARRPIRFTRTSEMWSGPVPVGPGDLEVRLLGCDFDSVDRFFGLPSDNVSAVPVSIVDESSRPSLRVKLRASAQLTRGERLAQLEVSADGVVELGSIGDLLADVAVRERGPFDDLFKRTRLPVPGLMIEVVDDTDFLLAKRAIRFGGAVTVDETTETLIRSPRFVAGFRSGDATHAGTPAQVILRVLDAADIRSL